MYHSFRNAFLASCALCSFVSPSVVGAGEVYGPTPDPQESAPARPAFVPEGVPYPLVEAVSTAAREHPLIERALADRRAQQANLRGARWQRFPSLSIEGLAVTQGNQIGAQDGLAANLILEQPLYTFGRIGGTIEAADAALETSSYGVIEEQIDIALLTVAAYFDLSLATERERV